MRRFWSGFGSLEQQLLKITSQQLDAVAEYCYEQQQIFTGMIQSPFPTTTSLQK